GRWGLGVERRETPSGGRKLPSTRAVRLADRQSGHRVRARRTTGMNIYVINKSTVFKDAQIRRWLPAFDVFADHVREWWPRAVSLVWCPRDKEPALAWKLIFADKSDEAGGLGYHDFTPGGRPVSYIFAAELKGASPTVTATHEIAEMIADPWISENFQVTDTRFFAKEICDPCEADEFAYSIKVGRSPAVAVSDFVLPKWFI